MKTAPKDGTTVLWYIDYRDGDPAPGIVVGHWVEDPPFNIKTANNAWNGRGALAWMPAPNPPSFRS